MLRISEFLPKSLVVSNWHQLFLRSFGAVRNNVLKCHFVIFFSHHKSFFVSKNSSLSSSCIFCINFPSTYVFKTSKWITSKIKVAKFLTSLSNYKSLNTWKIMSVTAIYKCYQLPATSYTRDALKKKRNKLRLLMFVLNSFWIHSWMQILTTRKQELLVYLLIFFVGTKNGEKG